jgi:probable blue pigment (indigoidine) exporter
VERDERTGSLLAAGAAILFGTAYVATAFALRSFTPISVALWRGIGAVLLLLLVLAVRGGTTRASLRRLTPTDVARLAILGVLAGPLFLVGMNLAVAGTGATIAAFVAGLYAVLAAVFAPVLLHERLGLRALVGFLVALAGTALLAELDLTSGAAAGIAAGLGAAVIYALYLVLSRRWAVGGRLPGDLVSFAVFFMIGAVLLPFELAIDPAALVPASPAPEAILALGWLIVAPSAIANLMIQASVRRVAARRSSAFLLLNPIAAAVCGALLLGERLTPPQVVGAALVLVGIAVSSGVSAGFGGAGVGGTGLARWRRAARG